MKPPSKTRRRPSRLDGQPLPAVLSRLLDAADAINQAPPDRPDFLHAVLCQVGMPRSATTARTFTRQSGKVSMLLEAGKIFDGHAWRDVPLPYGTRPRLVMIHLTSEAVRTQSPVIDAGDSIREFLTRLGIAPTGGPRGGYTAFRRQMQALAACRLSLGMVAGDQVLNLDAKPIRRFDAWLTGEGAQRALWPGVIELSAEFYETLATHAVPLDPRALAALKHSALALDAYTWAAHRLYRVKKPAGELVPWARLQEQFGGEYGERRDFKNDFRRALRQVLAVYPDARLEQVDGGLLLRQSPPPVGRATVAVGRSYPR